MGADAMDVDEAPKPTIRELSPGMLFRLGTPEHGVDPVRRRHEGHHPILMTKFAEPTYLETHSWLYFDEWATVPNSIFTKNPLPEDSTYELQIHRDGKRYRWRNSSNEEWHDSKMAKPDATGRRRIMIRGQNFFAAVLVLTAFYGPRPEGKYDAGHAHGVYPGVEPREASHELNWLTYTQNQGDDKRRAGTANAPMKGKHEAVWARPLDSDNAPAVWATITDRVQRSDGHEWARFASQSDAARGLKVDRSHLSSVLKGKYKHAGNFTFERDTIDEPLEADRVLVSESEQRYVTRDGKLMRRKSDGTWIELTQTPDSYGYVYIKSPYEHLPGEQKMHRLVFRAFANDRIEAKIAETRRRYAYLTRGLEHPDATEEDRKLIEKTRAEYAGNTYADFEIDHVNEIKHDNRLENLEILTKAEHKRKTHGKCVYETTTADRSSKPIKTFATITAAASSAGMAHRKMSKWLANAPHSVSIPYRDGSMRHFHKEV